VVSSRFFGPSEKVLQGREASVHPAFHCAFEALCF
jgi:hypothetical protein